MLHEEENKLKACENCRYAFQDPSWNLRGLWCTAGADLDSIDRSVDWGYDYVEFRAECVETERDCWCARFKAQGAVVMRDLDDILRDSPFAVSPKES